MMVEMFARGCHQDKSSCESSFHARRNRTGVGVAASALRESCLHIRE